MVDIIVSKTFDNGTICASEQTVVIDDEIYDLVLNKFAELGAHVCNEHEAELLARTVIDPKTGFMQPMAVGQKAIDIARFAGTSCKAGHETANRGGSRRRAANIPCRLRNCFRCSRCIARNPLMRR